MSNTGRFIVTSQRTGKTYVVEPTGNIVTNWGNVNPATGKIEHGQGAKGRGAIDADDSIITPENGFNNIELLPPGTSPFSYIEKIDSQYSDKS